MTLLDDFMSLLQQYLTPTSIGLWLSAVVLWLLFKISVRRAARSRPGRVGILLLPFLALVLIGTGSWQIGGFLFLLFLLVVVVAWPTWRQERRGAEMHEVD